MLKHRWIALGLIVFTVVSVWKLMTPPTASAALSCQDFSSQAAAQTYLRQYPTDPDGLDRDRNGIACENNPCPCNLTPVARISSTVGVLPTVTTVPGVPTVPPPPYYFPGTNYVPPPLFYGPSLPYAMPYPNVSPKPVLSATAVLRATRLFDSECATCGDQYRRAAAVVYPDSPCESNGAILLGISGR
jgi:hypothetical protein